MKEIDSDYIIKKMNLKYSRKSWLQLPIRKQKQIIGLFWKAFRTSLLCSFRYSFGHKLLINPRNKFNLAKRLKIKKYFKI